MSEQFLDWDGAQLDGGTWQGIEYLSMQFDAQEFPTGLTVHLARPVDGFTEDSVVVTGGKRIVDLDLVVTVTGGSNTIDIAFNERGDHSDYTVRLLDGGADLLHPFFCSATFNFYVNCPTGDCRDRELLPDRLPDKPPAVDLQNKDFRGFMKMVTEWVRVTNPNWADLAPASQERMLIELLCHQADMLSYYQDRIGNEAFIETASERHSLRQHGTLLGYPLFDGEAAQTVLAFDIDNGGFLPGGLGVEMSRLQGERPVVFYVLERTLINPDNNGTNLRAAAWPGADEAAIPLGASKLLLWGQPNALQAGMRLAFTQGDYWQIVTLTEVLTLALPGWVADPGDAPHTGNSDLTEIQWDQPLTFEPKPWDTANTFRIHGNLVDASHGAPRTAVVNPMAAGSTDLIFELNRANSTVVRVPRSDGSNVAMLRALKVPEGPVVSRRNDSGALRPVLTVTVGDDIWSQEEHLHNSQAYDTHYVASTDHDGSLWLQFGDGVNGREIAFNAAGQLMEEIRLDYRIGHPLDGNCARDALTQISPAYLADVAPLGDLSVTNVSPGSGGRRSDTADEIRQAIPDSIRHGELERAVALSDYAAAAAGVDGVARAAARALGGVFNTVLVLVDPEGAELSDDLRLQVWERIDEVRMAGREHFVCEADYVPLHVELIVCVEPGFLRHEVRDRVLAEVRPGTDERMGFFHPDKLSFGETVERGDLIAHVQRIPGVRSVKVTVFQELGERPIEDDTPLPEPHDRLVFGSTEVARLDADPNFPENGVLDLAVVGLDTFHEDAYDIAKAPDEPLVSP